jgi:hypothetical protein
MDERTANDVTRMMRRTVKNKKTGGTGGGGSFSDRYTPQKGAAGKITPIALFRAEYAIPVTLEDGQGSRKLELPYGIVLRHYHKPSNRFCRCSAGLVDVRNSDGDVVVGEGKKPCLGCNESAKGKETGMAWSKKLHVFNGILMADFHLVNSNRKNDRTGEYYKDPVQCEGRICKYCDLGTEKKFGRRVFWPVGKSFTEQLSDFVDFNLATNCNCGGVITIPAYECPNCGVCFRDLEAEPADKEELEELCLEMHKCRSCGETNYMDAVHECDACNKAQPLKLWDVKMELFRSGEGTATSLQFRRFKAVTPDEWKKVAPIMNQIDLDKVFPHVSIKEQANIYKLKIPPELRDYVVDEESNRGKDNGEGSPRSGSSAWDDDDD